MTSGPWTLRSRASDRHAEPVFLATMSALFAMSTTVTIIWSSDMSAMPAMPMAGGCLARQFRLEVPEARIVIEKRQHPPEIVTAAPGPGEGLT